MMRGQLVRGPGHASGSVLLLAMIFTLLLAIVSATMMQTAVLEFLMAGNDQFYEEAIQDARAIATELSHNRASFSMKGAVGYTRCPAGDINPDCDTTDLQPPGTAVAQDGVELRYRIVRQGPLIARGFPFRESEDKASSIRNVGVAIFEVDVAIDGSERGLGRARLVQGIAVRLASLE